MTLQEAYEILKKVQNKTATKEEQQQKQKAFEIITANAGKALKGL